MLPLVAKGQSIGLVELISTAPITFDDEHLGLARTMANEAAMALENARLYEDARALADRDPLTGFYNHRFLHERLGEEVVRAQRARRPLSVLMLDLDDFKLVNDTFGHLFGDRVLTWTAELIRSTLRASDIAARYGGDEFAFILPETDGDEARRAAERILEAFRDHAFVGEQRGPVPIGASIGVATFPAEGGPRPSSSPPRTRRSTGSSAMAATTSREPATPPRDRPRAGRRMDVGRLRRHPLSTDVTDPTNRPGRPAVTPERRIRRAWWIFAASFFVLGLIAVLRVLTDSARPMDWAVVGLVFVVGAAAIRHREAVAAQEVSRREEAELFARILSGLSRSVAPDAILGAIVDELASATGADHIVVARRRPDARVLEATLVSARPGVPDSTTRLPIADLEDPVDGDGPPAEREPVAVPIVAGVPDPVAAGRFRGRFDGWTARLAAATPVGAVSGPLAIAAARAARGSAASPTGSPHALAPVYGLSDTLAAPLTVDDRVIGAIVLSHRTSRSWSETDRRLLIGAAGEASSALSRAYSLRAAEAQASTDALTGLPNRRYFDEFCGLLARRRRSGDAVGVLMIDIDKFKALNDAHGHATGDVVLRAVGGAIVSAVREDDVPARYGGEEFVVLLRNPSPEIAFEVGERVRTAVAALDLGALGVPGVTVSVGVAVARQADQPIADLIAEADRALYRAKRAGRDRVVAA